MTETLWVEPRLRGFVVTADRRNPSGTAGRFIPYDLGWAALQRGMGDVPREDGVEPLRGVKLRVASDEMRKLARRAMERDFGRRLRDCAVHAKVRTPTAMRWAPWVMIGLGLLNVGAGVFGSFGLAPGLTCAGAFVLAALVIAGFARINTVGVRIDGHAIEFERLDGRMERRPLNSIEHMTLGLGGAVVRFHDAWTARFDPSPFAARTLFRGVRRVYAPESEARESAKSRQSLIRIGVFYWPLGCVALGVAHWWLGASNGFSFAGRPILSAVLSAMVVYFVLGGMFVLQLMQPRMVAWFENRSWRRQRRKAKLDRRRGARPAGGDAVGTGSEALESVGAA